MTPWARLNLILAIVVVLLLTLRFWPAADVESNSLTQLDPAELQSIRISRANRLELALQRDAEGWQLTHPDTGRARPARVTQLLAITRAPVVQSFSADVDLARYGLDPPAALIELDDTTLAFGDLDPSSRHRYVKSGERIYVVDSLFFNLLTLPPKHFIEN